ncbi:UNVERIFIED_CONTAM: hypothetical protein H355_007806 [Colinus virginianus]|nr:hypothetical protein H355_007806 [Colinus virginianus]
MRLELSMCACGRAVPGVHDGDTSHWGTKKVSAGLEELEQHRTLRRPIAEAGAVSHHSPWCLRRAVLITWGVLSVLGGTFVCGQSAALAVMGLLH